MPFLRTAPHTDNAPPAATQSTFRPVAFALFALSMALCAAPASAAGNKNSSSAQSRYQQERAACYNGQSNQDRATCLREAGAARGESTRGQLNDGQAPYEQNALTRCKALPSDDRQACERRIRGEGASTGSVGGGGIIREIVTPAPADGKAGEPSSSDSK